MLDEFLERSTHAAAGELWEFNDGNLNCFCYIGAVHIQSDGSRTYSYYEIRDHRLEVERSRPLSMGDRQFCKYWKRVC